MVKGSEALSTRAAVEKRRNRVPVQDTPKLAVSQMKQTRGKPQANGTEHDFFKQPEEDKSVSRTPLSNLSQRSVEEEVQKFCRKKSDTRKVPLNSRSRGETMKSDGS